MCSKYVFVSIFLPMYALLSLCMYLCVDVFMYERMEGLMCAQECKYMNM